MTQIISTRNTSAEEQAQAQSKPTGGLTPLITLSELVELTRLSRAQISRLRQEDAFPRPLRISPRRIAWRAEDIGAWLVQCQAKPSDRS